MPPVGFEPTISAGERQQTYTLDRATIGIGNEQTIWIEFIASIISENYYYYYYYHHHHHHHHHHHCTLYR
jgi:hypothetical protein